MSALRRARTPVSLRRHRAGPQFPNDRLPGFRILTDLCQIELAEREPGRQNARVVAREGVLVESRGSLCDAFNPSGLRSGLPPGESRRGACRDSQNQAGIPEGERHV